MSQKLDTSNPLPRYFQVYSSLLERIRGGEFAHQALPAERQLAKDYGVSRITIVKAMDNLKHQGVIDRQHGRGTFVRSTKLINDPAHEMDFSSPLQKIDSQHQWQLLDRGYFPAPAKVANWLKLDPNQPHFQVTLLMKSDDQPVGYHHIGVRHELAIQHNAEQMDDTALVHYVRHLPKQYQCACQRGFEAVAANEEDARWLDISPGEPVLQIDLLYTDSIGQIVQFIRSRFRGDRFRYNA